MSKHNTISILVSPHDIDVVTNLIFTTIDKDAKTLNETLGFLGKSFKDIGKDFSDTKGLGNKLKSVFTPAVKEIDSLAIRLEAIDVNPAIYKFNALTTETERLDFISKQTDAGLRDFFSTVEDGKASLDGYNAHVDAAIAEQQGLAASSQAAAVGVKLLSVALNMVAVMVIAQGVQLLVKAFDEWIHRVEIQQQKIKDLESDLTSLSGEISNLSDELTQANERIKELESKGPLSFLEKDELSNLQRSNEEIRIRLALLREEERLKKQEIARESLDHYNKTYGKNDLVTPQTGFVYGGGGLGNPQHLIAEYKQLLALRDTATTTQGIDYYNKKVDETKSKLIEMRKDMQTTFDNISMLDTPFDIQMLENVKSAIGDIDNLILNMGEVRSENFNDIFNAERFSDVKERLIELAQAGKLTEDEFVKVGGAMADAFSGAEISASEAVEQIQATVAKSDKSFGALIAQVAKSTDGFGKYSEELSKLEASLNSVIEIQRSLADGNALTFEQLTTLLGIYPQLNEQIDLNAKNYGITIEVLDALRVALYDAETAHITTQIESTKQTIESVKQRIKAYQTELQVLTLVASAMSNMLGSPAGAMIGDALSDSILIGMEDELAGYENQLVALEAQLALVGKTATKSYANIDTAAKAQGDAFQAAYSKLQYMRDRDLISQIKYIDELEKINNQHHAKGTEAWRKYELEIYNLRKQFLDDYVADQEKALQKELEASNKKYDAEIKRLQAKRKEEQEYYSNQINILKERLELENASYDLQIKAIQDKISALNKQYTEEEKLLKIQKAQQDLAKAQSQKTALIYREGVGFEYDVDMDSVSQAQESLTDLLQDWTQYKEKLGLDEQIQALRDAKEQNAQIINDAIKDLEVARDESAAIIDASIEKLQEMKELAAENINEQIEKLQELKEQWADSLDISEDAEKHKAILDQIFSDEKLSNQQRIGELNSFVNEWNSAVSRMKEPKTAGNAAGKGGGSSGGGSIFWDEQDRDINFSSGGVDDYTGLAMLHGTPSNPELILNSKGIQNVGAALGADISNTRALAEFLNNANKNGLSGLNSVSSSLVNNLGSKLSSRNMSSATIPESVINNVSSMPHINIGDIILQGVQNVDALADEIRNKFPNVMLQKSFART